MKQKQEWKAIQNSFAISGYPISDEDLELIATEYETKNMDELARKIVQITEETGRPMLDVAKEILGDVVEGNRK
jgi:hypothetical protein